MLRNSKIIALLIVVICTLAFSGCIETKQKIKVDEKGMAMISFSAIADKKQAGSELSQAVWQAEQMVPQLNTEYDLKNYNYTEGYTDYLVYEWTAKNKMPVKDIKGVSWKASNDSYDFRLNIDPLFNASEITESNKNDVVTEINLTLPKQISIANTPFVKGNTARWVVTKELLTQNNTLRALTT